MSKSPLRPVTGLPLPLRQFIKDHVEQAARPLVEAAHTFGAANTEERVRHRLGRPPTGFKVIGQDAAGTVYESGRKHDRFFLYLKSSAASLKVRLETF